MFEMIGNPVLREDMEILSNDTGIPFDMFKGSCVLVTGATGLIGYQLTLALMCLNDRYKLDMKLILVIRNQDKVRKIYGALADRKDLVIIKGDVREPISDDIRPDYIFHCASITASRQMIEHPVDVIATSLDGTRNMLELARRSGSCRMVFVSSMEMYGSRSEDGKTSETDMGIIDPMEVRSCYPESKRMCEALCKAYSVQYGLDVCTARLSQTFGAGILPGENRVFAQFARSVMSGQDIVLHTRGLSEGNYCYTRDTVRGLMYIALSGKAGEAYNISNEDCHTTIADMARMVCEEIGNGISQVVFDIPESNIYGYARDTRLFLDSSKLRELGWKPEVGLKEAYLRMIEGMKY